VVVRIHHDTLDAHAETGHASRRYPYPYVPTLTDLVPITNNSVIGNGPRRDQLPITV
jgi:hypothetical protein